MENNKKIAFDFKERNEETKPKTKEIQIEDLPKEEPVTEEFEKEEKLSEIELLKEDKDRNIDTSIKHKKQIVNNEEYIPVSLPGNVQEKKITDFKTTLKNIKNKWEDSVKLEPITIDKKDLKVSIISIVVIIIIGILIYISGTLVYEKYIKKEPIVNNEIITVYIDEDMPYYHYENCQHLKDGKRYIKLEEEIAKQLGYILCNK